MTSDGSPNPVSASRVARRRTKQRESAAARGGSQTVAGQAGRSTAPGLSGTSATERGRAASLGLSAQGMARLGLSLDRGSSSQAPPADDADKSRLVWPGRSGASPRAPAAGSAAAHSTSPVHHATNLPAVDPPVIGVATPEGRSEAMLTDAVGTHSAQMWPCCCVLSSFFWRMWTSSASASRGWLEAMRAS